MPKVSVILTSYNHAKYLRSAIDSVLNQTFTDFELIIGDDASTDESWDIIQSYSDHRIHAYRHETKRSGGVINELVSSGKISCEYIAIQHSDDIWELDKLERQLAILEANPQIGAVFAWAQIVDENGESFQDENHSYYKIFRQPNRTRFDWLNHFFYNGNALCHPSVLIRKECYTVCGLYRYGLAQLGDLDMWVRLCLKYEIHVLPEKLLKFRVRANEDNTSGNRPETHIRGQFEFLQIYANYLSITDRDSFLKIFPDAAIFFENGKFDISFALAMMSLKSSHPFGKLFGLQLLYNLINDPERALKIERDYGFRHRDLIELTAKYDVFSVVALSELQDQLKQIKNSRAWHIALMLQRVWSFMFPPGSWRRRIVGKVSFPFRTPQSPSYSEIKQKP